MSANNNLQSLNGLFKEVYSDKIETLIPEGVKLLKKIPFIAKDKQNGSNYHQPVVLGLEHGCSFSSEGDAFTLNDAIAGTIKDATVKGSQIVLRSILSYTAASRAMGGGVRAFEDATKFLVANMLRSITRKLEISMFYGKTGYGTVGSVSGNTVTITSSEWASGIWSGAEGMIVNIRSASGSTSRGEAKVVSVDLLNQAITLDSIPAGTVATDVIWHKGAYNNEFLGLHQIIDPSDSTLFGIDHSTYNLFKGNVYDANNASLSLAKVTNAVARAVEKGLDGDVTCFVSPRTWSNMMTDQTALRQYDSSYKSSELENGSQSIKFYGQNGTIAIEPSIFVKQGYSYIMPVEEFVRIGSSDVTFKRPGQEGQFFRDMDSAAGYELRCFADMGLFCAAPGKSVLIKNIVNS